MGKYISDNFLKEMQHFMNHRESNENVVFLLETNSHQSYFLTIIQISYKKYLNKSFEQGLHYLAFCTIHLTFPSVRAHLKDGE